MILLAFLQGGCVTSSGRGEGTLSSVTSPFPVDHLKQPLLPPGSQRYRVAGDWLHVRTLGARHEGPAVVLLSGPTDSWASDSAWYALLQPLLARSVRTHAVDRAGQAFSSGDGRGGYAAFGRSLAQLLAALGEERVLVVAFASANLALHHHFARVLDAEPVIAALLVDPDSLHPELLDFYASQAEPFQADGLEAYVRGGHYDERARALHDADRDHVLGLLSETDAVVFQDRYFDRVLATRLEHPRILARMTETARYDEDVRGAAAVPWPATVPVWSFDTAFEQAAIEAASTPDERARYERWQSLSSAWMASLPGGCHLPTTSREHLALIAEARELAALIRQLRAGAPCPDLESASLGPD